MIKKIIMILMIVFVIIGIIFGIYFAVKDNTEIENNGLLYEDLFKMIQNKNVEVNEIFTYGRVFNFSGTIKGISKDNFENAKLYITNRKRI